MIRILFNIYESFPYKKRTVQKYLNKPKLYFFINQDWRGYYGFSSHQNYVITLPIVTDNTLGSLSQFQWSILIIIMGKKKKSLNILFQLK